MAKVSVIIPVYKVEGYISRCVDSLLSQTIDDVEFIFVDDCTPDKSIEIVRAISDKYPARKQNITILSHHKNCGLPSARNSGLANATGEYIFHCDSDDFAAPDMLEKMYTEAKRTDADVVWCDWYLSFKQSERYMRQPNYSSPEDALRGMLNGTMKFNVWNKLVKKSLYEDNDIRFPDGYDMGEDMTMIRLLTCASRVSYIPEAYYHYVRTNAGSFTQTFSDKHLSDITHNTSDTVKFILLKKGKEWEPACNNFMLNVKLPFLISENKSSYKLWQRLYPESDRYIWGNKSLPVRTRLLQLAAHYNQLWYVWLYNKIIIRFVYGILYR